MFLSYEFVKDLKIVYDNTYIKYVIKIVDTDFVDEIECISIYDGVISMYEKRGLNVASNFMLSLIYYAKEINSKISYLQYDQGNTNPKFAKYKKEFEKYKILL
jgi:hypothetical protein